MTDLNSIPSLSEDELETLGVMLEDEAERQDSFDFFAVHGLMTALISGPVDFELQQVLEAAFDEKTGFTSAEYEQLKSLLIKLSKEIQAWLDSGQDFPVPADLTLMDEEGEPPLESWAMGYMTTVLLQEEEWYKRNEDDVAQHLFPIMYASGLFMDEPEMADIDEDVELSDQMCGNIPAAVIGLYLMLHAEK
ncbi:MAG: hypothetical protein CMI08_03315 [Oceanospirillaceae bacterium]|uniref:YecA/YgfB family protein n=1 Tax=unclassified Thalassolituus TaxID=2624967 RepID=UPI000C384B64|nr:MULTISPECIES: YecA family protein [unclassified Thalassolituus]MAS23867.1 hypothetical protein [Oceanospirillaceae bacterium]MAX98225.1 hypothetical protein [Oceanospirillaceae bacterium]MBM94603.1 hypothetical protein [Oceanospirillaceae bacterium]MBS53590.1 hypothetical protein [Oceanospirillaceae bacterium]|tara:strand:- start:79 stop:654 length:576 start_codon:yes stop_codon:yes gene_type:complete